MGTLDLDLLLRAYAAGVFPMADSRDAPDVYWVEPRRRGVLPLDGFRLSRSLAKVVRSDRFAVTVDTSFAEVVAACAAPAPGRPETWISPLIESAYAALHDRGRAHAVSVWADGELAGGLYGVSIGRAFFGESMFSRRRDASKVALTHLVARLRAGGYTLLDCQFITDHLASLGAIEITRATYRAALRAALSPPEPGDDAPAGDFGALDRLVPAEAMPASGSDPHPCIPGRHIVDRLRDAAPA